MIQSSNEIIYALTFIGVAILFHAFSNRKSKTIKEDCQEGFGIILNGELILDSNRPLIFDTLEQAQDHASDRGFDKKNALNPMKKVKLQYVFQRWFVGEQRLILHPLQIQEGEA